MIKRVFFRLVDYAVEVAMQQEEEDEDEDDEEEELSAIDKQEQEIIKVMHVSLQSRFCILTNTIF